MWYSVATSTKQQPIVKKLFLTLSSEVSVHSPLKRGGLVHDLADRQTDRQTDRVCIKYKAINLIQLS